MLFSLLNNFEDDARLKYFRNILCIIQAPNISDKYYIFIIDEVNRYQKKDIYQANFKKKIYRI